MKICRNCGTQNEDNFIFCRNCGTLLDAQSKNSQGGFGNTNQNGYGNCGSTYKPFQASDCISDFDGVSIEEMRAYIGTANSQNIINQFAKMQLKGSKTSWCWPAFFLTLIFGFSGGAMWLLYRKVYKQGFICAALGIIETFIRLYVMSWQTTAVINLNGFSPVNAVVFAIRLISILSFVIMGLFSYSWYKSTAIKRIKAFKECNFDHPYYLYGISQKGGTSGGMLAVSIILYIIPSFVYIALNGIGDVLL